MKKTTKIIFTTISMLLLFSSWSYCGNTVNDGKIELTHKEYLQFKIGYYVWGFNEFDTDILILPKTVKVNIYYDHSTQNLSKANTLKKRFEQHVKIILKEISWAKDFSVIVTVYGDDRSKRGY